MEDAVLRKRCSVCNKVINSCMSIGKVSPTPGEQAGKRWPFMDQMKYTTQIRLRKISFLYLRRVIKRSMFTLLLVIIIY